DRLGQADVCNRLSALGLRRPEAGLQDATHRGAESQDLPGQRKGVLRFAMSRQVVARKAEVAPGSCKIVTTRGRSSASSRLAASISGSPTAVRTRAPSCAAG